MRHTVGVQSKSGAGAIKRFAAHLLGACRHQRPVPLPRARVVMMFGAGVCGMVGTAPSNAQTPSVITLPAGFAGESMSADGRTVVGRSVFAVGRGVVWTADGGLHVLPAPTNPNDALSLSRVNGEGSWATGSYTTEGVSGQDTLRVRFGESPQLIPRVPGTSNRRLVPVGISNDGRTIGGSVRLGPTSSVVSRWTESGGTENLGRPLPGGDPVAYGMSGDGTTIVGRDNSYFLPWRWSEGEGFRVLATPSTPEYAGTSAEAWTTNRDGSITIGTMYNQLFGGSDLVQWNSAGTPTFLGRPTAFALVPRAMSDDGFVVVGENDVLNFAALWTADHGFERMSDYLARYGLTVDPTLRLRGCVGVSADGRTILVQTLNESNQFVDLLVTVPSPGFTGALFSFLMMTPRRRRPCPS